MPAGLDALTLPWQDGDYMGKAKRLNLDDGIYAFESSVPEPPLDRTTISADATKSSVYSSESLRKETISASASVEYQYAELFSATGKVSFLYKQSELDRAYISVFEREISSASSYPEPEKFKLSDKARNMSSAKEFYDTYGYWYLAGVKYGMSFTGTFKAQYNEMSSSSDTEVSVKAVMGSLSVSTDYQRSLENLKKSATLSYEYLAQGWAVNQSIQQPLDLQQVCDSMSKQDVKNKIYAIWRPYNQLESWPSNYTDDDVVAINKTVNTTWWQEVEAVAILQSSINAIIEKLQSNPKGVTPFRMSNQFEDSDEYRDFYCTTLSNNIALNKLRDLATRVSAAQELQSGVNFLRNPAVKTTPDGSAKELYSPESFQQYVSSGHKQSTHWASFFVSQQLRTELQQVYPGLPLSILLGTTDLRDGRHLVDTYTAVSAREDDSGHFGMLCAIWCSGYYSVYGVQPWFKMPVGPSPIGCPRIGDAGGPGGGAFNPFTVGLEAEREFVTEVTVQLGRAEKGDTDNDLLLSIDFTTNKQGFRVGTGDNRGPYTTLSAPTGCCLHGLLATSGSTNDVYSIRCIWIPKEYRPYA